MMNIIMEIVEFWNDISAYSMTKGFSLFMSLPGILETERIFVTILH